ncbi:MAG: sterol desaturase family protein [Anaerolineae bacterium]|nr:sterol desaturase family protein [Gemmatimonadaceae bacterium]
MSLDHHVARIFDDQEPTRFGSGWLSGTTSVFLGAIGLAAVACFHFPELLSSPDVRARLPMPFVRTTLQLVIGFAFLLGLLSTMLRRRKVLGATGMTLALLASLAGGGNVPVQGAVQSTPMYLGLDWFLLNVLLLSVLFVPLERFWPLHRDQSVFRPGWTTDGVYLFASHLLVQVSTLLTLMPARVLFSWAVHPAIQTAVQSQPVVLQFLGCVLVADLSEYAVHRLFHRNRWLWPFHAVHHSSTSMDWLAGSRLHVVDVVLTRGLTFVPLFLLGFDTGPLYAYLVFVSIHAVFIHANVSWRFPRLVEALVVTPRFHHWHHGAEAAALDKNFAVHLPWIDKLFGTYHCPEGKWPAEYGIAGNPVPDGYLAQLAYPVTSKSRDRNRTNV